jgi:putative ABC transport system substrate-binding protein
LSNFGFSIADFRLGAERMNRRRAWVRWLDSFSDNRKSKIQNRKLVGIIALVVTFAFGGAVALAQQPKKVPRIGYLSPRDPATESTRSDAIRLALRELGYIEGQNIATEYRYAQGKSDRFPELAAELVRLKVDIILVAGGSVWVQAAMNATKTISIVMTGVGTVFSTG